ncbi:hypothetical protein HNQ92_000196 [Rhabdobacter roseus]|uniref:Uncharacterized protein n=1 Tax=Rhabdobacter roseus TaxID=1655419 RepID=A0A840TGJ9_9BACT|nr:hypothetical protein [Rhabdobacter roseus]
MFVGYNRFYISFSKSKSTFGSLFRLVKSTSQVPIIY